MVYLIAAYQSDMPMGTSLCCDGYYHDTQIKITTVSKPHQKNVIRKTVKLYVYLIKHCAMKTYESGGIAPGILDLQPSPALSPKQQSIRDWVEPTVELIIM